MTSILFECRLSGNFGPYHIHITSVFVLQLYDSYYFFVQSIGSLQKKYNIGSFELLSKTAPIQAVSLLVLGPIIDYYLSANLILDYKFTSGAVVSINLV